MCAWRVELGDISNISVNNYDKDVQFENIVNTEYFKLKHTFPKQRAERPILCPLKYYRSRDVRGSVH